ncbi:helix-turn-helix domain-containing protein [Actinomadura livida]|uniref:Helix-turn-helix transcriptional regulator n=1 Tax=Actinomadura livida TaxID=79909 RepID=A0A7W7MVZ1_9ACTN|nr:MULTISPECIES: helix-turn-helix transcriptional regulator [Actinomadura]MBB4772340.1 transcriptional regulator with XRE-family HTH domain [Actinomadura catellatispora]GGU23665.1 transcriptional regulator [Actinomadura livida]
MLDNRQAGPSSTALRMQIGARLRRMREAKGIGRAEAGRAIRGSASKMSRLELGRHGFKLRDIADLLDLYGVDDAAERASLIELAKEARKPGWWQSYGDAVPSWFEQYLGLEQSATTIRNYEVQYVPGLLQTAEYARAVIALEHHDAAYEGFDRRVCLRMSRQQILHRPVAPARLWTIIDEAALRRPIGGAATMRAQIEHLIEVSEDMPNVKVQVLPFAAGGHVALGGPITIVRFAEHDLPDMVYLEQLTGARYPEGQEAERYQEIMDLLAIRASRPATTTAFLKDLLNEF